MGKRFEGDPTDLSKDVEKAKSEISSTQAPSNGSQLSNWSKSQTSDKGDSPMRETCANDDKLEQEELN